jgi:hypothetical protein
MLRAAPSHAPDCDGVTGGVWYGRPRMTMQRSVLLLLTILALVGCDSMRKALGLAQVGEPSELKSAETRWLLIKNPRYGDVASEPEYIWVEENKVPLTFKTLIKESSVYAAPEIVAKYGPPPGGGKISPRQGVPYQPAASPRPTAAPVAAPPPGRPSAATSGAAPSAPPAPAVEMPKRGYVVHVETTRIAVDLTSADGLRPGTVVSVRRDKMPIMHPVTGEKLGELDEEVATAKIVEVRDKFSLGEIQSVQPGSQIEVRDRVVPK